MMKRDILSSQDRVKILLVDDRQENLFALSAILSDPNYAIVTASSGAQALSALLRDEFAVVLLDIMMPEMDGYQVATLMKERERTQDTPIIFVTAVATEISHIFRGYSVGAVDYLLKPLESEIVRAKVAVFVDLFRKERRIRQQAEMLRDHERRALETTLALQRQESEAWYSTTLKSIGDAVIATDTRGIIRFISPMAEYLTGWGISEAQGRPLETVFRIINEETRQEVESPAVKVLSGGMLVGLANHTVLMSKSGKEILLEDRAAAIRTEKGVMLGAVIVFRDVTEKKRDLKRLEVLYEISKAIAGFETLEQTFPFLLKLAANALPLRTAILTQNRGDTLNTSTWHADDVSQEQIDEAETFSKLFYDHLVGPLPLQNILRPEKGGFIALPVAVAHRPPFGVLVLQKQDQFDEVDLVFADALTNLVAVAVDRYYTATNVAELREKHIADLEDERSLRESFVSILTHDLRNPLGAAQMSAELIFRKPENSDACKKMAGQIKGSIKRVDHMIEDLLDTNRIRAGEPLPLKIEELELHDAVKTTLDELSVIHGDRIVLTGDPVVRGYWSRDGIRRAIENLINNAVKYGAPDRPITVCLKQTAQSVQITVHNEGNPIPAEDLVFLFERFRRRKSTQTSGIRGWGLGLTLVRGVAEAHGGTAQVRSTPTKGTTFIIELPLDCREISPLNRRAS